MHIYFFLSPSISAAYSGSVLMISRIIVRITQPIFAKPSRTSVTPVVVDSHSNAPTRVPRIALYQCFAARLEECNAQEFVLLVLQRRNIQSVQSQTFSQLATVIVRCAAFFHSTDGYEILAPMRLRYIGSFSRRIARASRS